MELTLDYYGIDYWEKFFLRNIDTDYWKIMKIHGYDFCQLLR